MNAIDNNLDESEVKCIKLNNINCEICLWGLVSLQSLMIFNGHVNFSVDNFIE